MMNNNDESFGWRHDLIVIIYLFPNTLGDYYFIYRMKGNIILYAIKEE